MRKFSCVQGCSDCCIYRQHYPSPEYGKIGVLLLPEEKATIERLAKKLGINVKILPRLAIGREFPEKVIAYQLMGKNPDGDLCPFLDVEGNEKSPHGGYNCKIYSERPLACRAYPVIDVSKSARLDDHCQFCKKFSTSNVAKDGIQKEIEALAKIQASVTVRNGDDGNNNSSSDNSSNVWRYATATGAPNGNAIMLPEG
ncbi:MAG TPA: YkgJ family cysteine cluster protein, partial [Nitrososphaera sp.]|nr:YkgJ family cysteine cluster protein [Nitrososphaera sp.]